MKNEIKTIIPILVFFILVSSHSLACKESYIPSEDVIIEDVIISSMEGATCNITIYLNNTEVQSGAMTANGLAYQYNASTLELGTYVSGIECSLGESTAWGSCNFVVTGGNGSEMQLAIAIVMLGLIGLFMWLATQQKEDSPFRIGYFLLALFMIPATLGITRAMAVDWGIGTNVVTVLESIYNASLGIVVLIVTLVGVFMLVRWLRALQSKKLKKERGEYDGLA